MLSSLNPKTILIIEGDRHERQDLEAPQILP